MWKVLYKLNSHLLWNKRRECCFEFVLVLKQHCFSIGVVRMICDIVLILHYYLLWVRLRMDIWDPGNPWVILTLRRGDPYLFCAGFRIQKAFKPVTLYGLDKQFFLRREKSDRQISKRHVQTHQNTTYTAAKHHRNEANILYFWFLCISH